MKKVKIAELILDYNLYPRTVVDRQHIAYMAEAENAGAKLPPVLIDAKTKKVIDGFHRITMWRSKYGDEAIIEVEEKRYADEKEMLLDSIRLNAHHGRVLTTQDRVRCTILAEKLHIDEEILSSAMCLTVAKIGKLRVERIGRLKVASNDHMGYSGYIPLKRTIEHKAGQKLTKRQAEANDKLSGMNQSFYVNQIILLIENNLLNKQDERLMKRLKRLYELLEDMALESVAI